MDDVNGKMNGEMFDKSNVERDVKLQAISDQIHFYLGDANLRNDKFFLNLIYDEDNNLVFDKLIPLNVFLNFNKIKELTNNIEDLKDALKTSKVLKLENDSIKRIYPLVDKQVDECTIYLEFENEDNVNHKWFKELFSVFGQVDLVRIPKRKNGDYKGYAFIEFEDVNVTKEVLDFYDYLSIENLKKIRKDFNLAIVNNNCLNNETKSSDEPNLNRKRRLDDSEDDEHVNSKKVKQNSDLNKDLKLDDKQNRFICQNRLSALGDLDQEHRFKITFNELNNRFKTRIEEIINYHVSSKSKWEVYKGQYSTMKKKLKNSLNLSSKSNIKCTAANENNYDNGLILKLNYNSTPITDKVPKFKTHLRSLHDGNSIAYIDLRADTNECFIRFKDISSALNYSKNVELNNLGTFKILEGEEEKDYWNFINESLNKQKIKKQQKLNKTVHSNGNHSNGNHFENISTDNNFNCSNKNCHPNKPTLPEPKKGLVIKFAYDVDLNNELNNKEIRKKIKEFDNTNSISYIDLDIPEPNLFLTSTLMRKYGYIRFSNSKSAFNFSTDIKFKEFSVQIKILDGDEEKDYWNYFEQETVKSRKKNLKRKYQPEE